MFSRHYILVLRAEVSNWFYICKRAVKLSWLSFQYFSAEPEPPLLHRFNPTVLQFALYTFQAVIRCPSHFQIVAVMPQWPGLTTRPPIGHQDSEGKYSSTATRGPGNW